jgi:hypothetical protein
MSDNFTPEGTIIDAPGGGEYPWLLILVVPLEHPKQEEESEKTERYIVSQALNRSIKL